MTHQFLTVSLPASLESHVHSEQVSDVMIETQQWMKHLTSYNRLLFHIEIKKYIWKLKLKSLCNSHSTERERDCH